MKNKSPLQTIRNTVAWIEMVESQVIGLSNWNDFQRRFKSAWEASRVYKNAKAIKWLREHFPIAAKKGYLIENGEALPVWLWPGENHWMADTMDGRQIDLYLRVNNKN